MNSQYKKGVLELCVLSLLAKQDCYGYDVANIYRAISRSPTGPCIRSSAS
jgi:DNA-binding PadR family transcriptional regulator